MILLADILFPFPLFSIFLHPFFASHLAFLPSQTLLHPICPLLQLYYRLMLKNQPIQDPEGKKNLTPSKSITNIFSDLQYSIFSNLLKRTSDSLFDRETEVMAKSNQLLDSFTGLRKKQIETTADTHSMPSIFEQLPYKMMKEDNERRMIRRKSPKLNQLEFTYQKCMKEIEENCSRNVANDVKKIFEQVKRLQRLLIQYEIKERKYECKLEAAQKKYEENLILLKKMKDTSRQLKKKTQKIKVLEEKNKNLPFQSNFKDQLSTINSSIVKLIKDYIDERQHKINSKANIVKEIEGNIENVLDNEVFEEGCEKCCIFLKKIKGSILQYKAYLTEEDTYIQKIYQKYKKAVFKYD